MYNYDCRLNQRKMSSGPIGHLSLNRIQFNGHSLCGCPVGWLRINVSRVDSSPERRDYDQTRLIASDKIIKLKVGGLPVRNWIDRRLESPMIDGLSLTHRSHLLFLLCGSAGCFAYYFLVFANQ